MIRTQIYIDKELHRELLLLAKEQKEPMAKIAREMLRDGVKKRTIDRSGKKALRALLTMRATSGPKDLSRNIDHYLYGAPKK